MHKPNNQADVDGAAPRLETITATMEDSAFTAEQLPGLWQQIEAAGLAGGEPVTRALSMDDVVWQQIEAANRADADPTRSVWRKGIEAMYRRCDTYPQHTQLAITLAAMPADAWHTPGRAVNHAINLLKQATPEQLIQALEHERQHPDAWWTVHSHLLIQWHVTAEQLTGPVIEQLLWSDRLHEYATTAEPPNTERDAWRRIIEHIQQQLLGGNENAWDVFLDIADPGTPIGDIAAVAAAIEH